MALKNLSLAGSLFLVALGLFANAGVVWVSATQEFAHAGELKSRGPRAGLEAVLDRAVDGIRPAMPLGGGEGCVEGEPLEWFGPVRELPWCGAFVDLEWFLSVLEQGVAIDVNADGRIEHFIPLNGVVLSANGVPAVEGSLIVRSVVAVRDSIAVESRQRVCSTTRLVPFLSSFGFPIQHATSYQLGWRDVDGDGDKDAIFSVRVISSAGDEGYRVAWLENTGFEATQPLVGDLDGDGAVGARDLTMLLGGWTGN